jgi:hypothetical protein
VASFKVTADKTTATIAVTAAASFTATWSYFCHKTGTNSSRVTIGEYTGSFEYTITGLDSGTDYVINLAYKVEDGEWKSISDTSQEFRTFAIPKLWSWTASNGNATAAQTKSALALLQNHGLTADFSRNVWNDLADRVGDLANEAGNKWITTYSKDAQAARVTSSGDGLTAKKFNALVNNLQFPLFTWTGKDTTTAGHLGRLTMYGWDEKGKNADICYGYYIVELARIYNAMYDSWLDKGLGYADIFTLPSASIKTSSTLSFKDDAARHLDRIEDIVTVGVLQFKDDAARHLYRTEDVKTNGSLSFSDDEAKHLKSTAKSKTKSDTVLSPDKSLNMPIMAKSKTTPEILLILDNEKPLDVLLNSLTSPIIALAPGFSTPLIINLTSTTKSEGELLPQPSQPIAITIGSASAPDVELGIDPSTQFAIAYNILTSPDATLFDAASDIMAHSTAINSTIDADLKDRLSKIMTLAESMEVTETAEMQTAKLTSVELAEKLATGKVVDLNAYISKRASLTDKLTTSKTAELKSPIATDKTAHSNSYATTGEITATAPLADEAEHKGSSSTTLAALSMRTPLADESEYSGKSTTIDDITARSVPADEAEHNASLVTDGESTMQSPTADESAHAASLNSEEIEIALNDSLSQPVEIADSIADTTEEIKLVADKIAEIEIADTTGSTTDNNTLTLSEAAKFEIADATIISIAELIISALDSADVTVSEKIDSECNAVLGFDEPEPSNEWVIADGANLHIDRTWYNLADGSKVLIDQPYFIEPVQVGANIHFESDVIYDFNGLEVAVDDE